MRGVVTPRDSEVLTMLFSDRITTAWYSYCELESNLLDHMIRIAGADPHKPDTWPFEDIEFDPVDWDGCSVEIRYAKPGFTLSANQLEEVWKLGFNVVCIHYKEPGPGLRYVKEEDSKRVINWIETGNPNREVTKCKCCEEPRLTVHSCFPGHDCQNALCEWCNHPLKNHNKEKKP